MIQNRGATHSPRLIVVRRELVQELLDAVLLAHRVDVRNLVLGQRREVEVDLQRNEMMNYLPDNNVAASISHEQTDRHSLRLHDEEEADGAMCTDSLSKVCPRLRELASAARGSHAARSQYLAFMSYSINQYRGRMRPSLPLFAIKPSKN